MLASFLRAILSPLARQSLPTSTRHFQPYFRTNMASEVRRSKRNHASSSTSDPSFSTSSSLSEQPSPAKKPKSTKAKTPAAPKAKADPLPKKKKASSSSETKKPAAYLQSPFPDYERPTPEECELVTDKLASLHGLPVRPGAGVKKEPNGSVGEACGAVPSVLDALSVVSHRY
jgi:hypothetical protein